jgi:hypothetical protein
MQGTWSRSNGSFPVSKPEQKSYDASRRKVAKFLGLDALYTAKVYFKSVQADDRGLKTMYLSDSTGKVRKEKPLSKELSEAIVGTGGKFIYPRSFERCGLFNVQRKVEKLSYLVHVVTQSEHLSRKVCKDLSRLSLIWSHMKYNGFRKFVHKITVEISKLNGCVRNLGKSNKGKYQRPTFTSGEIVRFEQNSFPVFTRRCNRE